MWHLSDGRLDGRLGAELENRTVVQQLSKPIGLRNCHTVLALTRWLPDEGVQLIVLEALVLFAK